MKLKTLEKKIVDDRFAVFVDVGDDLEVIEIKPYGTDGYDWFAEYRKIKAYGDSTVVCMMYSEALKQIVVHTKADGRKEIG